MNQSEMPGARFDYRVLSVGDMLFIASSLASKLETGELNEDELGRRLFQMFEKCLVNADEVLFSMLSTAQEEFFAGLIAHVQREMNITRILSMLSKPLSDSENADG